MTAYALCQLQHARDLVGLAFNSQNVTETDWVTVGNIAVRLKDFIWRHTHNKTFAVLIPTKGAPTVKYQAEVTPADREANEVLENLSFINAFNASVV